MAQISRGINRFIVSDNINELEFIFRLKHVSTNMRPLMPSKGAMMIEAFLTETAPKFKQALMFFLMIFQKLFRFKRFSTETAVELSSRMVVHVFFVSAWG